MSEEIDTLWSLYGMDERIVELLGAMARFPELRRTLGGRVDAERTRLQQLDARLAELQRRRRESEREIAGVTEQERKYQSQLPAVKKNEEYTALLHEIEGTREKRSALETTVLIAMEAEEKEQGERPALERALQAAQRDFDQRGAAIDAEEAVDRERLAAVEAERATMVVRLPPLTRTRYERTRTSKGGRGVVPIVNGACGGCFRSQPPQAIQEAKRRDRLIYCDGCGRILVWPPDGA